MKLTTLFASVVGGAVTINLSALTCTATPKERPSNFDSLTIQIPQQAPVTTRRPLLPVDIETPRYNTENAYGQEGLTVASKIDDRLYSATYQQQPAILQCYDVSRTYRDEMNMQIVINDVADRFLERAILNGKNHIAKLKHVFNVPAGACMIYNSGGAWNLAEYTKTLNLQQKALFLPRIFNQVLDGK
ncbi:hypothetical protein BDF19DRAFT_326402 [Syncephalis fuscata]|nr:hypothetical protein BDF19DRAFT_326402 [Syncephalis fuscata]